MSLLAWLAGAAAVGAADVLYFHLYKFRLYQRAQSRLETGAHLLQGASFALICVFIASADYRAGVMIGFILHFVGVFTDALLERRSRESLGGLPSAEYLLHIAGATLTGGALATFLGGGSVAPEWSWLLLALGAGIAAAVGVEGVLLGLARSTRG